MKYKLLWLLVIFSLIPVTSAFSNDIEIMDITPEAAYELVTTEDNAFIIDVRTSAEWKWVGHPGPNKLGALGDLDEGYGLEGKVINISSVIFKKGLPLANRSFLADVNEVFGDNPDVILITICRSGGRALAAAKLLVSNGYNINNVYRMVESFEGSSDERGYRTVNGWVNAGLPYSYTGPGYKEK